MVSLSNAKFNMNEFLEPSENKTVESIPIDVPKKEVKIFFESHLFNCIRYDNEADKGFTDNLINFLLDIVKSDKVLDENIKLIANTIMNNCVDHQIRKYSDEEITKIHESKKDVLNN